MTDSYWGDQGFGSYSGRVPSTGEYLGPYDTAEELAAEIAAAECEAATDNVERLLGQPIHCAECGCVSSTVRRDHDNVARCDVCYSERYKQA